jgi:hypothetical protein
MDVKLFKLINGQEIVAEVVAETTSGGSIIKNPLVVHMMRGENGAPSLGFAEWSMIAQEDQLITLHKHACISDPLDLLPEVAHSYEQQMSSLILPPEPAGKILLG